MKEYREIGSKKLIKVFTYKVNTSARDCEIHMFFSWEDMYKYHEQHHSVGSDKWVHDTAIRWEEESYIERLKKQGFVKVHTEVI